jgi:hypothetical protein
MARRTGLVAALAVTGALAVGFFAFIGAAGAKKSDSSGNRMHGYFEVPAISSPDGRGTIEVRIRNASSIDFTLTYSRLSTPAMAAHIHFAQRDVNGGIVAFLCGGGTEVTPCPPGNTTTTATVTGTILPAEIQAGAAAQGIAGPADFAEVLAAIKAGVTYANVHTGQFGGGEIRGQIKARGGGEDDDDD